ncbi:hypothetical protein RBWH47_00301 [Rhodopirellula baltica WH47]|uniref:Uncharacterized protein n=1 Tax=Rhodopirellula baltica WH47 TaxID=991778 RepID=F2AUA9_RHOBT|nr:hypothetical protein RBWH47_00301 [Rhodopirellula baltica WH47]
MSDNISLRQVRGSEPSKTHDLSRIDTVSIANLRAKIPNPRYSEMSSKSRHRRGCD